MSEFKPQSLATNDIVNIVGAMAGVWINNPEQQFLVRLAVTQAQAEICGMRGWSWLRSVGTFTYSAGTTRWNMHSVASGAYRLFGRFLWLRCNKYYDVKEVDGLVFASASRMYSTSDRPLYMLRTGSVEYRIWPVPTAAGSVSFGFIKSPPFVYGNGDIVIPERFRLTALATLARQKVWELKGDARAYRPDPTISAAMQAMIRDEELREGSQDFRPWRPLRRDSERVDTYSGFYSTGNMP